MTRAKLGLLYICAVVLGVAVFGAVIAQAQPGAKWLILNAKGELKTATELPVKIGLEKDSLLQTLHTEILKIKVLFLCTEIKAVNAELLAEGSIGEKPGVVKNSKILFSGCTTDLNGAAAPECTPKDPTDGEGFIVSKPLHGLVSLHELPDFTRHDIIVVLPDEGKTLGTVTLPAACPIGTSVPILGKLAYKDCEGLALVHLVKHLLEKFGALTSIFAISETAEHAATYSGNAWAFLLGVHQGLKWSWDPI